MLERSDVSAEAIPADVLLSTQPVLMRGLVTHWPLVQVRPQTHNRQHILYRRLGA